MSRFAFDGAHVAEEDPADVVVGRERQIVFEAAQEHHPTADFLVERGRADPAELEAAKRLKTAGVEAFEDRRVLIGDSELSADREDVAAAAVAAFIDLEELPCGNVERPKL